MPTIYHHEILAYRSELSGIDSRVKEIATPGKANITHATIGSSNRKSHMLVGMCSLVEAHLFDLVKSNLSEFKLTDLKGQGISRLKLYLTRTGVLNFGDLKYWDKFSSIYKIRNEIVHSYGGMLAEDLTDTINPHLLKLGFSGVLVGARRIRIDNDHLLESVDIVDKLLLELGAY